MSIEFLVSFSVVLIIFIILSFFLYQKFVQGNEIKIDIQGKRVSNSIAQAINEVYISGEGFSQTLTLPEKISLENYLVEFYPQEPTVFVYTERQSWSSPLSTPYVNCTLPICSSSPLGITTMSINSTLEVKVVNRNEKIYLEQ